MSDLSPRARDWLKQHQHFPLIRAALDAAELGYQFARGVAPRADLPAIAGGWPVRCVPFPAMRPFTRHERVELRRVLSHQNASFFDGSAVQRFERAAEQRFGSRHVIAVSSGTAALHVAMSVLDIGPGDEVIVPVLTYVSTALAVVYQRGVPRFVDAHPTTWNIDPAKIEAAVTPRTKAIVVMHVAGVPCDMDAIGAIAARHGLPIVEDAAQAHGSTWRGRHVGTIGRVGCFSFQSAKTMATGEGGAILTDDDELARRARAAMNLGESPGRALTAADAARTNAWEYPTVGWNYRMSALQAAVGLGQLARFDAIRSAHERNARDLERAFAPIGGIVAQSVDERADPCRSSFFVRVERGAGLPERDEIARALARERVDYRMPYARPLSAHAVFGSQGVLGAQGGWRPHGDFPVAEDLCRTAIGFRIDPSLRPREMRAIGSAMQRLCAWSRARSAVALPSAT